MHSKVKESKARERKKREREKRKKREKGINPRKVREFGNFFLRKLCPNIERKKKEGRKKGKNKRTKRKGEQKLMDNQGETREFKVSFLLHLNFVSVEILMIVFE